MNTRRITGQPLPLGDKKGFDENLESGVSLKSVAESGVLLESLIRSRNKWLYHTFPKYTSKPGRGGNEPKYFMGDPDHPPSFHKRGSCDVDMGPHTFPNTTFYEVYRQGKGPSPGKSSSADVPSQRDGPSSNLARIVDFSEILSDPHETREYIRRMHNAMASDPTYAAAVRAYMAQQGGTVDDLLAMLRSMMGLPQMPFDLAISFEAAPSDRYLIPRDPALFEMLPNDDARLTVVLPFNEMIKAPAQPIDPDDPPAPVRRRAVPLVVRNITPAIVDTFNRWIGDEERVAASRTEIDALKQNITPRLYLGPHVNSNSDIPTKLRASAEFPMKSLKQGPTVQRPVRPRQAVQDKAVGAQSTVIEPPTIITTPSNPIQLPVGPSSNSPPAAPDPLVPAPPSQSEAGLATLVSARNPYASMTISSSYAAPTYATSAQSSHVTYPPFPQPAPPPALPFAPSASLSYPSTSVTTPYGSQLHLTQAAPLPTNNSPYYTYAHYHPSYAPYPSRPNPIPRTQSPTAPRYQTPVRAEMKCLSCGAKDVPLYYGGRFCRPCQNGGLDLDHGGRASLLSNEEDTRHASRPAPRVRTSLGGSRPRSRPRHSTHATTPTFSLTPATFDNTGDRNG